MVSFKKKIQDYIILIFALSFVLFFYGDVVFSPNSYLFNNSGDGIKNYYTYAYQIKNNESYINLEGMNYPFGEHFFYTDSHPIFAFILQNINKIFPTISDYSIGIINSIMILSIFLVFIVIYKLFKTLKTSKTTALIGAISIGILAPQIFRLTGHYALSYSVAIPLTWLLLIKKDNPHYTLLLLINNTFWLFIHAYLGIIIISFSFLYLVILYLTEIKKNANKLKPYLTIILSVIIPILIFQIILILTDTHINRTDNPSGFFLYNAELDDVFLPSQPPLNPIFNLITPIKLKWEAWSYVGICATIFLIILIVYFIKFTFTKQLHKIKYSVIFKNKKIIISLISSIILLLFAFGVPFKQIHNLIDYFPIFKQFRATGRFAWVFYFVFTLFFFYSIDKYFIKKTIKYIILIIVLITYISEGYCYHYKFTERIKDNTNIFSNKQKTKLDNQFNNIINFNNYQAIIPIPFFAFGSENFSIPNHSIIDTKTFELSYQYKIPMLSSYLTRTSITENKTIITTISPSFYPKPLKNYIKSNKPFLIVSINDNVSKYQQKILDRARFICKINNFKYYSITPNKLFEKTNEKEFNQFYKIKSKLFNNDGFLVNDTNKFFYYNSFEDSISAIKFRGKGSFNSLKRKYNTLAEFYKNTFKENTEYTISIWIYNGYKDALNQWLRLIFKEYDNNNNTIQETFVLPEQSEVIFGNWSLIELTFTIKNSYNTVKIYTQGKDLSKSKITIDDLLITEKGLQIYKITNDRNKTELFKNNHKIIKY